MKKFKTCLFIYFKLKLDLTQFHILQIFKSFYNFFFRLLLSFIQIKKKATDRGLGVTVIVNNKIKEKKYSTRKKLSALAKVTLRANLTASLKKYMLLKLIDSCLNSK